MWKHLRTCVRHATPLVVDQQRGEEGTGEEAGRGRNGDVEMNVWCYKDGQNTE